MNLKSTPKQTWSQKYFGLLKRRKSSDRLLLQLVLLGFLVSLIYAITVINNSYVTPVPKTGGTLVEGIVGTPRFVNPVLAITRADRDTAALVYSGLVTLNEQGELVPDVAENIEISEDGQTYSVKLREDVYFHNGSKLTAKDVAFTIAQIQNPDLKSPLRGNWSGVLVEELGEYELNIVVEEAYAPFIENLTVGILPRALWDELPTEQIPFSLNNTEPVGSGPYQVTSVMRSKSGLINSYQLKASNNYQQKANLDSLILKFYQSEDELYSALEKGEVMSTASLSAEYLARIDKNKFTTIETPLPRTFAIYFNQNKSPILREEAVRQALDVVIDREKLINEVLNGYAISTYTPVPAGFGNTEESVETEEIDRMTKARGILIEGGWSEEEDGSWTSEINEEKIKLSISISTANTALFDQTANYVASVWKELGVEVSVSQFEQADLVQAIIRPRDFQALLFGADIGRQVDLYPFWHSSQKSDPGLNISQYTNIDTDALLKKAQATTDRNERMEKTNEIAELLVTETPAIFLFTPTFGYVYDKNINLNTFPRISNQSERFANIASWYISSEKVWPVFQNN